MTCPECHRENPLGNRFCGSCGVKLPAAESKVDPHAPSVTWLKSMEEREAGSATEAERVTRQREMAERAERAALRERELAVRAEAERVAIREREAQRASSSPERREESNNRTRPVGAPSFLGLNESYDEAPDQEESADYQRGDIYGGGRSYSRALLLLFVLMVVGGLVFLQWRYSNGLKASLPVEKPSATQPSESASENPEATQEDALAQKNADESANPESDAAANAQNESKSAANSAEATKKPSDTQSAKDEAKPSAEKTPGQEPKASNTDQQKSAAGEAEEPVREETAQQSKPNTKPSPRTQREQVPDVSDEPVRLAESYLLGRGLPQSCPQAVSILREAANRGNYKAQIKLGALYATGNCVSQDRVQAYRFFTRALQGKPGNTWVEQNRSMLWAHMNDQERRLAMEHSF